MPLAATDFARRQERTAVFGFSLSLIGYVAIILLAAVTLATVRPWVEAAALAGILTLGCVIAARLTTERYRYFRIGLPRKSATTWHLVRAGDALMVNTGSETFELERAQVADAQRIIYSNVIMNPAYEDEAIVLILRNGSRLIIPGSSAGIEELMESLCSWGIGSSVLEVMD